MKIAHSKLGRVAVLSPAGELSINSDFDSLQTAVGNAIDNSTRGVLIRLDAVGRLDCSAIGRLVDLRRRVVASGRMFGLVGLAPRHCQMLEILGLRDLLGVCDDEADALRAVERFARVASVDRVGGPERDGVSGSLARVVPSSWLGRTVGLTHALQLATRVEKG